MALMMAWPGHVGFTLGAERRVQRRAFHRAEAEREESENKAKGSSSHLPIPPLPDAVASRSCACMVRRTE
jgi:hypothetical protein